jgi:L-fuculose-phosphate aldolase
VPFSLPHPRQQLATIMARIYRQGMTTLTGGNLSILEENGDLWITPSGVDKGALRPQDMMCLRADGSVEGLHRLSSELPFHRAIYERRPDLRAVVHAHSPALVTFSMIREAPDTRVLPLAYRICGPVGYVPYAIMGSDRLAKSVAAAFAGGPGVRPHDVVLFENHSAASGGRDLLEAFQRLEALDFCARTLIHARGLQAARGLGKASGREAIRTVSDEQLALLDRPWNDLPEFTPVQHGSHERALRQQIVEVVYRAYDRCLMTSLGGVLSARVDNGQADVAHAGVGGFLITPTGMDRRGIEIEDLVLVAGGWREAGKWPSRSVRLHQAIYDRHPEVGCVIAAPAPHITAYALVPEPFDTVTIPESYVMLRHVEKVPFDDYYREPEQIAARLSRRTPVLILENEGVLTTGATILEAFDRLEVAEYSAQSLIDIAAKLGRWVPLAEKDLRDLEEMFGLDN